eukprot:gene26347-biopygen15990
MNSCHDVFATEIELDSKLPIPRKAGIGIEEKIDERNEENIWGKKECDGVQGKEPEKSSPCLCKPINGSSACSCSLPGEE